MKKLLWLIALTAIGCTSNSVKYNIEQESRALCREAADSILAHMPGWKEVYSGYIKSPFHVGENILKLSYLLLL